jgi:hypothetical protein
VTATPVPVAGVTRASAQYPWALFALAERVRADAVEPVVEVPLWDAPLPAPVEDRLPVELVREPGNVHDPNAIRVEVPALADESMGGHHPHVGWVPRDTARVYAERIDCGSRPRAWVRSVPIGVPGDMRPGLVIYVDWDD